MKNNDNYWYIPKTEHSSVLFFLLSIGGVLSAIHNIEPEIRRVFPDLPINSLYLMIITVGIIISRHVYSVIKQRRRPGLRVPAGKFDPFPARKRADTAEEASDPYPRTLAATLAKGIDQAIESHVLVTGPSGAGKSTLLKELVCPILESKVYKARNYKCKIIRNYDNIIWEIVTTLKGKSNQGKIALEERIKEFNEKNKCSIRAVFDETFRRKFEREFENAEKLWKEIEAHLDASFSGQQSFVLIFDQIERIIQPLSSLRDGSKSDQDGFSVFFLVKLIRYLRLKKTVRTVFLIRAEYLYYSYDFLENEILANDSDMVRSKSIIRFLCPGINAQTDQDAVERLSGDFLDEKNILRNYNSEFQEITGLGARAISNTFLTQLCGYMVESFQDDENVIDLLKNKIDRMRFMHLYFDYLFNDYERTTRSSNALEFLKAIFFAIAVENRIAGRPVTIERLSRLVHAPRNNTIEPAIRFLSENGLVTGEKYFGTATEGGEITAYWMVHDVISDYVLGSEQFKFNEVLKDELRGIIEAGVPDRKLIKVTRYASMVEWTGGYNIGFFAIWCLFVFGAMKAFSVQFCELVYPALKDVWFARECGFVSKFYVLTFLMHILWARYIYVIDRNYFQYTLRSSIAKQLSRFTPVIAVVLAIAVSQSPALFLIPVIFAGTIMGGLLFWGIANGSYVGYSAKYEGIWALRIYVNMVFVTLLMGMTGLILLNDSTANVFWEHIASVISYNIRNIIAVNLTLSGNEVVVGWMYVINAVMIIFYLHVRPQQQNDIFIAAQLALYDHSKFEHEKKQQINEKENARQYLNSPPYSFERKI